MSYKILGSTFKLNGDRIELKAYEKSTGVRIISHCPKDDKKYFYIGQAPKSNFLETESPKMSYVELYKGNSLYLQNVIQNLNVILEDEFYAEDISSPTELKKSINRQKSNCFIDFFTGGQQSQKEYNQNSKRFVRAFHQRKYRSIITAIEYLNSIKSRLIAAKLAICIPRSFPAYIAVSQKEGNTEAFLHNDLLLAELKTYKELYNNPIEKIESPDYAPVPSPGVPIDKKAKFTTIQPI